MTHLPAQKGGSELILLFDAGAASVKQPEVWPSTDGCGLGLQPRRAPRQPLACCQRSGSTETVWLALLSISAPS